MTVGPGFSILRRFQSKRARQCPSHPTNSDGLTLVALSRGRCGQLGIAVLAPRVPAASPSGTVGLEAYVGLLIEIAPPPSAAGLTASAAAIDRWGGRSSRDSRNSYRNRLMPAMASIKHGRSHLNAFPRNTGPSCRSCKEPLRSTWHKGWRVGDSDETLVSPGLATRIGGPG